MNETNLTLKELEAHIERWGNKYIGLGMIFGIVLGSVFTFIVMSLKVFN